MTSHRGAACLLVALIAAVVAVGFGCGSESATVTTSAPSPTEPPSATVQCAGPPSVSVNSGTTSTPMTLVVYEESSPTCSQNVDGAAMFDPSFRPEPIEVPASGALRIAIDTPGDVAVSVVEGEPSNSIVPEGTSVSPADDGGYRISLPGPGCFLVHLSWQSQARHAQFVALLQSGDASCPT